MCQKLDKSSHEKYNLMQFYVLICEQILTVVLWISARLLKLLWIINPIDTKKLVNSKSNQSFATQKLDKSTPYKIQFDASLCANLWANIESCVVNQCWSKVYVKIQSTLEKNKKTIIISAWCFLSKCSFIGIRLDA